MYLPFRTEISLRTAIFVLPGYTFNFYRKCSHALVWLNKFVKNFEIKTLVVRRENKNKSDLICGTLMAFMTTSSKHLKPLLKFIIRLFKYETFFALGIADGKADECHESYTEQYECGYASGLVTRSSGLR